MKTNAELIIHTYYTYALDNLVKPMWSWQVITDDVI